ncbi:alpha/beta fold hydrolase [Nocardia sp. NBC_01009]|uniref:alpha/beta fold hydrolase n=1 Tax=Nocardia sp. NBC_01009 TaxID=2975996 RepID=UPI00386C5858|nr:alpha/beta hydrolase [Nocardia sp. NBC_01009]
MTESDQELPASAAHYRGGSGAPLVLLHGGTSSWRCWESLLPTLIDKHDVLAPNLPGHAGRPSSQPLAIGGLADAVETVMDEAGFDTAHIAGNSLGGWVAMELARRGRARSVVALSPAGGWLPTETRVPKIFVSMRRQLRLGYFAIPLVMRVPALRRILMRIVCEHGDRLSPRQAMDAARDALACTLVDNLVHPVPAQTEPYGDLGIPILMAWGEYDRLLIAPRYCDPWRLLVPAAGWRTLPGVGHVPMYDDPALVADTILDWALRASATRQTG